MFATYVKYFPSIGKKLKMGRNGRVNVINSDGSLENYNSWDELNNVYKQLPVEAESNPLPNPLPNPHNVAVESSSVPKYYAFGSKIREKEIREFFEKTYNKSFLMVFDAKDCIYLLDSNGVLCQSSNQLLIDVVTHSSDWIEFKPKKQSMSKQDIAAKLGLNIDDFEIID